MSLRILFHNPRLLHPLNGGDRIRTYNMLRELRRQHEVTYLTLQTPADSEEAVARAQEYCQELITVPHPVKNQRTLGFYAAVLGNTLFGRYPFLAQKYRSAEAMRRLRELLATPGRFDLVICDYLAPMVNLLELSARPTVPMLLFQHNVESVIFKRHAEAAANPVKRAIYRRQWRMTERFDRQAADLVDAQVAVSEADVATFRELGIGNVLGAVPTGVDCEYFTARVQPPEKPVLAFLGAMDWEANQDAVRWFIREVLPAIRVRVPACEFWMIGRNPPASITALAAGDVGLRITGTVADVRPPMSEASAMVLPLRIGGGTRIKIYEAMAMGVPVLSTAIGAEGLDVTHGENILLADTAEAMAREAIGLLEDRAQAGRIAAEARRHVAEKYSWGRVAEIFSGYCREAIGRRG